MGNGLVVDGKGDKGFSDLELSRVVQCVYITVYYRIWVRWEEEVKIKFFDTFIFKFL